MIAYQTDRDGVLVGKIKLDKDPLEPNKWLLPAGAVTAAPPAVAANQRARATDDGWVVEDKPVVVEPEPETEPTPVEPTAEEKTNWRKDPATVASSLTELETRVLSLEAKLLAGLEARIAALEAK
jgi:hypothetical protein